MKDRPQVAQQELRTVSLDAIEVNLEVTAQLDHEAIERLAASIRSVGLLHPPLVEELESGTRYRIVAGDRSVLAARAAGLSEIPVLVVKRKHASAAMLGLSEYLQKAELGPIDLARYLHTLTQELGLSQGALARRLGKKRSTIANYLRLLGLPKEVQKNLQAARISIGHAKAILTVQGESGRIALMHSIIRGSWSVRQAEARAREQDTQELDPADRVDDENEQLHMRALERELEERFGTRVELSGRASQGQLRIHYYDLEDLDRILEVLGL